VTSKVTLAGQQWPVVSANENGRRGLQQRNASTVTVDNSYRRRVSLLQTTSLLIAVINDDITWRFKLPSLIGLPLASKPEVNYFRYVEVLFNFIFWRENEGTLRFVTKQRVKLLFFATGYDILQSQTRAQTMKLAVSREQVERDHDPSKVSFI